MLADPDIVDLRDLGPHEHGFGAGAPSPGIQAARGVEADGATSLVHAVEVALFGNDMSGRARRRRLEAEPLVVEYITRKEHAAAVRYPERWYCA